MTQVIEPEFAQKFEGVAGLVAKLAEDLKVAHLHPDGFKLPYVSRAMGHASQTMTAQVYSHEFEAQRTEEDDRAAERLEEFVG